MGVQDSELDGGGEIPGLLGRLNYLLAPLLQLVFGVETVLLTLRGHYFSAFMAGCVLILPVLFRRISIRIPPEMQLVAVLFAFVTLFLGEVRDFYELYWWWDLAIHFSSGLLLGLLGFMLVYMMNENKSVELHMRPSFIALFAFLFAVAIGAVWELFEFGVDQTLGTTMQKPRAGDPSGLTDTMWDLAVDLTGAAIVSLFGWWRMRSSRAGWLSRWIRQNPQLFGSR